MIEIDLTSQAHQHHNQVLLEYDAPYYGRIKKAVFDRDNYTCRCCGFKSKEHQSVISLNGNLRDFENMITVCLFCHQSLQLHKVEEAESGILIWLPEFTQVEINRITRILMLSVYWRKEGYQQSEFLLNELSKRSRECQDAIGTNNISDVLARLKDTASDADFQKNIRSVRLLPTQKKYSKQGQSLFNQFPKVLASWQKEESLVMEDLDLLKKLRELFFTEEKFQQFLKKNQAPEPAVPAAPAPTTNEPNIAELASKLLGDAATFFTTLAEQNPDIEKEMTENAAVFRQMGQLLKSEPTGKIDDKTHGELAGRLLKDAADFFDTLAEQNEPLQEQMRENSDVFRQLAELVEKDPLGYIGGAPGPQQQREPAPEPTKTIAYASQLLHYGSGIFSKLAEAGTGEAQEMADNATFLRQVADLLGEGPMDLIGDQTIVQIAIILMKDSVKFFETLGEHNTSIQDQIQELIKAFTEVAGELEKDPLGYF